MLFICKLIFEIYYFSRCALLAKLFHDRTKIMTEQLQCFLLTGKQYKCLLQYYFQLTALCTTYNSFAFITCIIHLKCKVIFFTNFMLIQLHLEKDRRHIQYYRIIIFKQQKGYDIIDQTKKEKMPIKQCLLQLLQN